MTSTRLRTAFRYPADGSDDENIPSAMDEVGSQSKSHLFTYRMECSMFADTDIAIEQEKLIATMREEDAKRNDEYSVRVKSSRLQMGIGSLRLIRSQEDLFSNPAFVYHDLSSGCSYNLTVSSKTVFLAVYKLSSCHCIYARLHPQ
jgi:hypothetical protein